jgi:hypothetical protein
MWYMEIQNGGRPLSLFLSVLMAQAALLIITPIRSSQ